MRTLRFDRGWSRRKFLADAARGVLATGCLTPLWPEIARCGDISRAYPEELLSIEAYTKGKVKTGDEIHAGNVEAVKDLLDAVRYQQVLHMGRRLKVLPTTTDIMRMSPWEYIEATLRNQGKGRFDARGNVVAPDGRPWIGGNPFPDPKSGIELFATQTLNWGRHDACFYAMKLAVIEPAGNLAYHYQAGWAELSPVARVTMEPKPYWTGHEGDLRYQSVFFTEPQNLRGTSFLNVWPYDHHAFPFLYGYVTEFRRIRQFPTDQRFEPLVPGLTLYFSDAWGAGDPLLTWGNYRIVGRGPFLAGVSGGWNPDHPNWEHKTQGGPRGITFYESTVELVPEAIVVEADPVMFPRAPISKKRVWFDARNQTLIGMLTYDRRGLPFRSFDGAYALYQAPHARVMDGAHPYWSWGLVHATDIQTGHVTRFEQVRTLENAHFSGANDPRTYDRYLTNLALMHLGTG